MFWLTIRTGHVLTNRENSSAAQTPCYGMAFMVHCVLNGKGKQMYRIRFTETRTITEGDLFDLTRARENIAAIQEICKRNPQKRAEMRAVVNAQLNAIATINARYGE